MFFSCQTQNNLDSSTSLTISGIGTSKLSERDKKQASISISVFGLPMVRELIKFNMSNNHSVIRENFGSCNPKRVYLYSQVTTYKMTIFYKYHITDY